MASVEIIEYVEDITKDKYVVFGAFLDNGDQEHVTIGLPMSDLMLKAALLLLSNKIKL